MRFRPLIVLLALGALLTGWVATSAPAVARSSSSRVSMNFVRADVVYVLKQLAKAMHMNIVTDSTVKGTVTMDLTNIPADKAMQLVLTINNLDHKTVGNIIVVGSPETLSRIQP